MARYNAKAIHLFPGQLWKKTYHHLHVPKWSSPESTVLECKSPMDCTDTSQLRYHNCSCGTRAVEKLMQYCMRTGTIPTKGTWSTSQLSFAFIPLLAEWTSVSRWLSSVHVIWEFLHQHTADVVFFTHSLDRRYMFHAWRCVQSPQQ